MLCLSSGSNFCGVPLFRCSAVVPQCSGYSAGVPRCVVPCSVVPGLFRLSVGIPCFVVPCSSVPGFIVCPWGVSGAIRVRISQELDVVAFWPCNLDLVVFQSWNLDVVAFVLSKNAFESRCHGLFVSVSRCCGFLVLESQCRGFLVLESRCRGFLVLESRCRGICASTASFSFSLNLLCHIINVKI